MLENKNGIFVFLIVITLHKKLSHGLVMEKDLCLCSVHCYCFVQSHDQFLNQTRVQKIVQFSPVF